MKICQFYDGNEIKYGTIKDDAVYAFPAQNELENSTEELILSDSVSISEVNFLPPVEPSKIVCVGRNYADHAEELGNEIPSEPLLFLKAPSAIITDHDEIIIPQNSRRVEHEGELGVVIGGICKNLTENDDPFDYILGYICLNDVTARDLQKKDVQFTRAKSFDTFCPISNFIETELDVADLKIEVRVNGEIRQSGRTSQMVFNVPFLIRYISNQMTLKYGDIIATGTPSGVSRLYGGDVCEIEIEGIGVLTNTIVNSL